MSKKMFVEFHHGHLRSGASLDIARDELRFVDLEMADLCKADLCGADLRGANLQCTNLCGADLRGANLHGADLCWADLRGADLRGADLRWADLCDAEFRWAKLRGALFHRAILFKEDLQELGNKEAFHLGSIDVRRFRIKVTTVHIAEALCLVDDEIGRTRRGNGQETFWERVGNLIVPIGSSGPYIFYGDPCGWRYSLRSEYRRFGETPEPLATISMDPKGGDSDPGPPFRYNEWGMCVVNDACDLLPDGVYIEFVNPGIAFVHDEQADLDFCTYTGEPCFSLSLDSCKWCLSNPNQKSRKGVKEGEVPF